MKTIFRSLNIGLILGAIIALGAVAGFAQDPCADADGQTKMQDEFDKLYAVKNDTDVRLQAINSGKAFLDKYGKCDSTKERSDWLTVNIPKMEAKRIIDIGAKEKGALVDRFNASMKTKNWDDTYASGKELMAKYPGEFTAVQLVLGSIGYDELMDRKNAKYSDQTLQYAKQSLADLEAGKEFKPGLGVTPFIYKSKDDAIAWMNLTIGSIYYVGQKNKSAALPYLFKATKAPAASDVSKNPNPYEFIGSYYFDELNKVIEQIQAKAKDQNATDTPEVAQKKVDDIKALVAQSNGISERAMDAYARAYTLGKDPAYKAAKKQNVSDAYKLRFNKTEGVDAWIAAAVAKPFVDPTSPVAPISDPEPAAAPAPVKTGAVSGVGAGNGSGVGAASGSGLGTPSGTGVGAGNGSGVGNRSVTNTVVNTNTPATKPVAKPAAKKPVSTKAVAKKKVV